MLSDELQDLPIYPSAFESIGTATAVMDEAQYELQPFWNGRPSVEYFICATNMSSVANTLLRLKEYRKVICNDPLNAHLVVPCHLSTIVLALSDHLLILISPGQTPRFAHRLANLKIRVLEGDNPGSGELT